MSPETVKNQFSLRSSYGREYNMAVYVKTISEKTIIVKCTKKQRAATIAETVERRAAIPRDMMYLVNQGRVLNEKKTVEENNIGND